MAKHKFFSYKFLKNLTKKGNENGQIVQLELRRIQKVFVMIFKNNKDGKYYLVEYVDTLSKSHYNYKCFEIKLVEKTEEQWEFVEEEKEI